MIADISDGVCAYIVGGLGNQLFILAAAWAQAERLGCPLYVDTSWYRHPESARASELGDIGHPGVDITDVSPWQGASLIGKTQGMQSATIGDRTLNLFTESGFGYDPQIDTIIPGTTVVGYYQSPKYFGAAAGKLREMLLSTALSPAEAEYIAAVSAARRISIHARRGDYLTPEASVYHGVAEPGYFSRALRLYDRLHPGSQYRIYTDSRELVAGEFAGVEQAELAPVETGLRSVAAMLAMATADGIIISNSTFSWWAGWLISERETNATVIAPRPWFRSGESASDLLLPDWITLDARN